MRWLYILLCACQFIYEYRCLKAKVIKTNFFGNDIPKNMHYTCIAFKNHLQICSKKYKCPNSDSDSSDSDLKSSDSGSELSDSGSDLDSDTGLGNLCFSYSVFSLLVLSWNAFFEGAI